MDLRQNPVELHLEKNRKDHLCYLFRCSANVSPGMASEIQGDPHCNHTDTFYNEVTWDVVTSFRAVVNTAPTNFLLSSATFQSSSNLSNN